MPNITVGCKLPPGIILKTKTKSVTLNGSNSSVIVGGYGLTQVDKGFYEEWKKEYANYSLLKNGLIFDQADKASAESYASEHAGLRSGLERLDPKVNHGSVQTATAD